MTALRVVAIVVAYNGGDAVMRCVSALRASRYRGLEVVVVDNASMDGCAARLDGDDVTVLRLAENLGFAGGVNTGIRHHAERSGAADIYALVNQDCIVDPSWLGPLVVTLLAERDIAVVGARLYAEDGRTLQHAGARVAANGLTQHIGRGEVAPSAHRARAEVDYVTGALCAFTRETWTRHGPFDERFFPAYFEEVDFCMRCRRAGKRIVYVPESEAIHLEASVLGVGTRNFLAAYHAGRLRFAAAHLLVRGNVLHVLRAELAWMFSLRRLREILPAIAAYSALPRLLYESRGEARGVSAARRDRRRSEMGR